MYRAPTSAGACSSSNHPTSHHRALGLSLNGLLGAAGGVGDAPGEAAQGHQCQESPHLMPESLTVLSFPFFSSKVPVAALILCSRLQ